MAITTQQQSNIIALTVGMFNAAPGAQYLTEFANIFENNGQSYQALADALASTNQYQSQFNGIVTSDGRIDKVLSNLGIQSGTDAYTTAKAHFEARIAEGATETELVVESLEYLLGDDTAEEFADVKAQLENKVEVATFYSVEQQQSADNLADLQAVVADVTADPATVETAKGNIEGGTGQTFTLTASADNFTGTAGNDTFVAAAEGANNATLAAGDVLDGGAGTDRLNLFGDANIAPFANADISNIEQVYARFDGTTANTGLNVSANADVEQAWANRGTLNGANTVTLTKAQTAGIEGTIAVTAGTDTLDFVFSNASAASGDAASLALNNANTTALTDVTIDNIETLSVAATGTNRLGTLADTTNSLATVNVTGAGSLAAIIGSSAITTVNASTNEGGVNLNLVASVANNQTITGGAGDDTITTTFAGLTAQDTINLGDGQDALIFTDVGGVTITSAAQAAGLANVSNVEELGLNAAATLTVDADLVGTAVNTFSLAGTANAVITDAADGVTLEAGAGVANAASSIATKLGANTVNVALQGSTAAASDLNGLTITGSSTVNVSSSGTAGVANNVLALTADDNNTINVTGDQNLTLTTVNAGGNTGLTINAADFGGNLTVTGTAQEDIIVAGAGNDTINASNGTDTLTGGEGNDTFVFAAGIVGTANMSTITDINSGDVIDLGILAGGGTFTSTAIDVSAASDLNAALDLADTAATATWFNFGGDTYVVGGVAATAAGVGDDTVVKLAGVQDLSDATFNAATDELTIA